MRIKTDDSYKAAYFMINGAQFVDVVLRPVQENKRVKLGLSHHWIITLEMTNMEPIRNWMNGNAVCYVEDLKRERLRLKRVIKSRLSQGDRQNE